MSDTPISSEHSHDKKRHDPEPSVLLKGRDASRLVDLSGSRLSPQPIPTGPSPDPLVEPELSLPEIIRDVPDIVYEFAKDVVVALSEREHFTSSEISSLKKAEVITGGIEIRGRRISEETTTTLAVYIGAVRTYLPHGQWKTDNALLFAVSGQNTPQERAVSQFAKIENSQQIIHEFLNQQDSREEDSILTVEEREELRKTPARSIRLSPLWEEDSPQSSKQPEVQWSSNITKKKLQPPERDVLEKEKPPENILGHSNFTRANVRELLESRQPDEGFHSLESQSELEQSVKALEGFYPSIRACTVLSPVEKRALRFNCELIVVQLKKFLRGASFQSGEEVRAHPALQHLEESSQLESSFESPLQAVLQDLRAFRKKCSTIL
jgi:hypothetical protein